MSYTADDLYALLPAVHRIRDAAHQQGLRDLLAVLAGQADVVDGDIARLLDNWFIETCDPWVVPYIGDLLRVRAPARRPALPAGDLPLLPRTFSQRAYVANTLAYRRRKGTAAVLEQLALDVTGWRARAVEFFRLLATTQHLNHLRAANVRTPDLRDTAHLELLGGPFETTPRTAELRALTPAARGPRRPPADQGRYNIPNVGLFLWRLQSYPVGLFGDSDQPGARPPTLGTARLVTSPSTAGYTFSPLGLDVPLFTTPRTEPGITHLATEADVPGPLRRRALRDELEARRQALVDGAPHRPVFFTGQRPALRVSVPRADDPLREVPPERIRICDLSQWRRPAASLDYTPRGGGPPQSLPIEVAVDPELGRLALAEGVDPGGPVRVGYAYGLAGDLGGGPYGRRDGTALWHDPARVAWQLGVTRDQATHDAAADPTRLVATLEEAVTAWNAHVEANPGTFGVIAVLDSATYREHLTGSAAVQVPAGARLAIVAAGWPGEVTAGPPLVVERSVGDLDPDRPIRPHLEGNLSIRGTAAAGSPDPGALVIQGLLVEGRLTVLAGNLGTLRLIDCTIVPGAGGLAVNSSVTPTRQNSRLQVDIDRSVCGAVALPRTVPSLRVRDSLLDGAGDEPAMAAPGAATDLDRVTVLGSSRVRSIEASNILFTGPVAAERLQTGCVRFSHVPDDPATRVPRRYRCQPALALADTAPADRDRRRAELVPAFTSTRFGDPGYGQLGRTCAEELRAGAEDGSEMGVLSSLAQPQRETSLRTALEEYLPAGLEAGFITVT